MEAEEATRALCTWPAGQLSNVWLRVSDKEFIVGNRGD